MFPVIQPIDYKLLFTGHSRGAALATLLAGAKFPARYTRAALRVRATTIL
ncbi:MAG: hypothetical protein DMG49_02205 [Acidobacteria bacterium]|nr:MAG: hypothetical protein DMG49_02205 [Acidobacteriota bacterium]